MVLFGRSVHPEGVASCCASRLPESCASKSALGIGWHTFRRRLTAEIAGDGDAPFVAVLEDARRRVREAAGRIATLLTGARNLAETEIGGALEPFSAQPREVCDNKEVVVLRKKLAPAPAGTGDRGAAAASPKPAGRTRHNSHALRRSV